MSLGCGSIYSTSTKEKINTGSSTEAELVSLDDVTSKFLWVKRFMNEQVWKLDENVIFRDNVSSIKLEENGTSSSGKRTRHFDIKYFYICLTIWAALKEVLGSDEKTNNYYYYLLYYCCFTTTAPL
jgi:hypothetical protein